MKDLNRWFIDYSLKNGLGKPAVSLYLRGCDLPIKCEDCHNYELQDEVEEYFNSEDVRLLWKELNEYILAYLSFHSELRVAILGGEPLTKKNRHVTVLISQKIKEKYPNSKIILYSWRSANQAKEYANYIDYGVLGVYCKSLYVPDTLPSSSNQYIYDFKNNIKLEPVKLKRG